LKFGLLSFRLFHLSGFTLGELVFLLLLWGLLAIVEPAFVGAGV